MKNITPKSKLRNSWKKFKLKLGISKNVYFVSGMCYNCSVFDNLELPQGYNKVYIEWEIPGLDEPLIDYVHRMTSKINKKKKFILVGYSFGGIIVQEMARFLNPEKVILISSMKDEKETPHIFQVAKKVNFADSIPKRLYSSNNFMINLFNRYVYSLPTAVLEGYMTVIDPVYIHWSLKEITNWIPEEKIDKLYHIHGTRDQVFTYEQIIDPITIKGGDHLMVIKRAKDINLILELILEKL